jgi:anaerobic sulfite reductase subunit B
MVYKPIPYQIKSIEEFTPDVKLLKVKSSINPKPGQFIMVSIPGIGECPLASCSHNKKYIDLLTRNAGNVTSAIFQLKTKDKIFIRGPYGKGFPIKQFFNKNLVLAAGGTGIAPVTSLINYIEMNRKKFKDIYIYFGFRNPQYILLKEKIKNWRKKFHLTICLDQDDKSGKLKCEKGFVHNILRKHKSKFKLDNAVAVLCGPEIMMQSVTQVLNKLGLEENHIFWSMERRMECGFGNCNRCLLQDLYVCKDGPVFSYDIIKPRLENENSNNIK